MFYFLTAYLMCLANIYLAGKEKALLYIVAFIMEFIEKKFQFFR